MVQPQLRIVCLVALSLAACGGVSPRPTTVGTYCANCSSVDQIILTYQPQPADALVSSLELTFVGCPGQPTTLPLSFDEGFVVKPTLRAGVPEAATGFASGELQIEACSRERFRGAFWLQRDDGSRIEGRIDGPLGFDVGYEPNP